MLRSDNPISFFPLHLRFGRKFDTTVSVMDLNTWLVFSASFIVLALNPGPAVLLVVSHGLAGDLRRALLAASGIAATNGVYFLMTALGLSAVLLASAMLFEVVRWAGIVYLIYAGIQMFRSPESSNESTDLLPVSPGRAFLQGMALQAGNPFTIAFFTALLPQFLNPASNTALQFVVFGATTVVLELVALTVYALTSYRGSVLFKSKRAAHIQRRLSGGVLIASAVGLALVRKR